MVDKEKNIRGQRSGERRKRGMQKERMRRERKK
jgi:hypothetical protein